MRRSKLIVTTDHMTFTVIEGTGRNEEIIASVRIPRAEAERLYRAALKLSAGQGGIFYGDGAGAQPDELPLTPQPKP